MLNRKRLWTLRVLMVASVVMPSFFAGHGAQAAKYDLCIVQEPVWVLGIKIDRLCIPLNI